MKKPRSSTKSAVKMSMHSMSSRRSIRNCARANLRFTRISNKFGELSYKVKKKIIREKRRRNNWKRRKEKRKKRKNKM